MPDSGAPPVTRRDFIQGGASTATAALISPALISPAMADPPVPSAAGKAAVLAQVRTMHAANVKRLQEWIGRPSIAAENRGYPEGAQYMAALAKAAGFADVELVPTSGKPGVFGKIDANARTTLAVYFMYDVKQFVADEWRSPPLEARLVALPGVGTVCMGRGAVNQKGPQNSFLSALHAFAASGQKLPVNLLLVCEGEEEIGSPHFAEIVRRPAVLAQLKSCVGVMVPDASQELDGTIEVDLGAKGLVELELISSGEKWGRGPTSDIHSSFEAQIDSPSWHLIQALNTLVEKDGHTPAIDGFFELAAPLTARQRDMILEYAASVSESATKQKLGVQRWIHDAAWPDALLKLYSQPTINIEGLVAGYTGPGGKTVLPHRAVAKVDMRLVPEMTAADTLAKLRAHLAKRGFADIEVVMSGGYDPTQTDADSDVMKAVLGTYRKLGMNPRVLPRSPASWPGYRFTAAPLSLPAGAFGLGHGANPHAPDEYYLIDSTNTNIQGLDGAVASFVELLYALA